MEHDNIYYIICKNKMERWYLYSVEQCSFGKRMVWTLELTNALIFTSENAVETFKSKNLQNILVDIHRILKSNFNFQK